MNKDQRRRVVTFIAEANLGALQMVLRKYDYLGTGEAALWMGYVTDDDALAMAKELGYDDGN